MSQVSRNEVDSKVLEKLFDIFFEVIGNNNDQEEFDSIIRDILSPAEKIMIAKRIAIIYLLMKNIDYKIICNTLKVSASTVSKFKFSVTKSPGIKLALNKIIRNNKIIDFFTELLLAVRGPGVPGVNWSGAWETKLRHERKKIRGI